MFENISFQLKEVKSLKCGELLSEILTLNLAKIRYT